MDIRMGKPGWGQAQSPYTESIGKEIVLSASEETKVELTTGGLYNDWTHYVTINIDNTRISLTIVP